MYLNIIQYVTLLYWNIFVTVAILGSLGHELDPVLDLGHQGIHAMAGALAPIAHHTHLGEPKYIMFTNCGIFISLPLLFILYGWMLTIYLPFSKTISGPPESPWHESFSLLLSLAQMW